MYISKYQKCIFPLIHILQEFIMRIMLIGIELYTHLVTHLVNRYIYMLIIDMNMEVHYGFPLNQLGISCWIESVNPDDGYVTSFHVCAFLKPLRISAWLCLHLCSYLHVNNRKHSVLHTSLLIFSIEQ